MKVIGDEITFSTADIARMIKKQVIDKDPNYQHLSTREKEELAFLIVHHSEFDGQGRLIPKKSSEFQVYPIGYVKPLTN